MAESLPALLRALESTLTDAPPPPGSTRGLEEALASRELPALWAELLPALPGLRDDAPRATTLLIERLLASSTAAASLAIELARADAEVRAVAQAFMADVARRAADAEERPLAALERLRTGD